MENLSTFKVQELYSVPAGVKFTIFQYGSLILVCAYTYNIEILKYGIQYKCTLPYDCYNTATAITGNNGSSGQFSLVNNILTVNSTDNQVPLKNTFMGELENLIGFKSEGTYQNSFSGNFNELKIFTYQSSSNIESGNQVHVKYTAPSGYEILTATIFWKDNVQINEPIGFDYERGNQDITVVYSTSRSSRSYVLTLFCKKV